MLGIYYTDKTHTTETRITSHLFKVTISSDVDAEIILKPVTNVTSLSQGNYAKYNLLKVSVMPEGDEEVSHTYTLSAAPFLAGTFHEVKKITGAGPLSYAENMIDPVNGHLAEYPIKLTISAEVTEDTDFYVYALFKEL